MEFLLAKSSPNTIMLLQMLAFFLRLIFIGLCLYLASHAVLNVPSIKLYLTQAKYQIFFHLLVLGAACVIIYYVPALRVIHALALIKSPKVFVWPDIILSGLALARVSFIWHYLFRYIERRST